LASSIVLEPLARFAPVGTLVPTLATEIPTVDNGGVAADFTSITWTLRDDVLWSDGTPFTANDVVFTWEYCANKSTGCIADLSSPDRVVAEDDHTVTITYIDPQPFPSVDFVGHAEPILQGGHSSPTVSESRRPPAPNRTRHQSAPTRT